MPIFFIIGIYLYFYIMGFCLYMTDGLYKQIEVCQAFDKALPIDGKYEDDASLIKIEL